MRFRIPKRMSCKCWTNMTILGILVAGLIGINTYLGTASVMWKYTEETTLDVTPSLHITAAKYREENYNTIPNIAPSDDDLNTTGVVDIALCTQTSLSNLHKITNLADIWDGPVSIAVFAFDEDVNEALQYILLLKQCSVKVQHNVRFHLVVPAVQSPKNITVPEGETSCKQLSWFKDRYKGENYKLGGVPYPVNVLRNVALVYASTSYVLNLDVDFLPSKGLRVEIATFLNGLNDNEKQRKLMYVLPGFESSNISNTLMLESKEELINAVKNGTVRQFHVTNCPPCHKVTNTERWYKLPHDSTMSIAYAVDYKPNYEPFYIAEKQRLPLFHGYFKQFGYNRKSQICEAHVSGFDLVVMNNGFVVHDGMKDWTTADNWKLKFNTQNLRYFDNIFKPALKIKYPNSKRTC